MNSREFFRLVRQMRHWQMTYFKTRGQEALSQSKYYERQVDNEIGRVMKILAEREL